MKQALNSTFPQNDFKDCSFIKTKDYELKLGSHTIVLVICITHSTKQLCKPRGVNMHLLLPLC